MSSLLFVILIQIGPFYKKDTQPFIWFRQETLAGAAAILKELSLKRGKQMKKTCRGMSLNMNIGLLALSDTLKFQIPSLRSSQYNHQENYIFHKGLILHSFTLSQSRIPSCSLTGIASSFSEKKNQVP